MASTETLPQLLTIDQLAEQLGIAHNPCRIDGGGFEHHPEQRKVTIAQLDGLGDAVDGRSGRWSCAPG